MPPAPPEWDVDHLLLLFAGKLETLVESNRESRKVKVNLKSWHPEIWRGRSAYETAVPFWLMAAGAWLSAIHARSRRRWLWPPVVLACLVIAAWSTRWLRPEIPGVLWNLKPRTGAAAELDTADLNLPGIEPEADLPRTCVLRWLAALRSDDDEAARKCLAPGLAMEMEPLAAGRNAHLHRDVFKFSRLLQINRPAGERPLPSVDCHLATLAESTGEHEWISQWYRFYFSESSGHPLISRIAYQ